MSYRVLFDGELASADFLEDSGLIDPTVTLEANKAGSFSFTLPPSHPFYDKISFHQTVITVEQDGEVIFEGTATGSSTDFELNRSYDCEGEFSFLNDTLQRQASYTGKTASQMLAELLAIHNNQCDATKTFLVGSVTVNDQNLSTVTDFTSTMQALQKALIEPLGGYFRVRHYQGDRYLDYLAASPRTSTQTIRIGKNLIDLSQNANILNLATVIVPRGCKVNGNDVPGLEKRLDVKTVNAGKDYIIGTGAAYLGYVWRTVTFDNITTAADLKTTAEAYLSDVQWANLVIEAKAFDLGLTQENVESFRILDKIRVISDVHGLDRYFMLTKMEIKLNSPGSTTVTLGESKAMSLSAQSAKLSADLVNTETRIDISAGENARQILESATGGNIYFHYDANGVCDEIRIMDTNDPNTAMKIWRWNINGWGYSDDGGQTYSLAATMNGTIYADFIKAGILSGIEIQNGSNTFHVSSGGTVTAKDGQIGGFTITDHYLYNYDANNDWLLGMNNVSSNTNWLAIGQPNNGGDPTGAWSNCAFRVTKDGKLYASDGQISGSIVSGVLSAANIYANRIYNSGGSAFISFGSSSLPYVQFNFGTNQFIRIFMSPTSVTPADTSLGNQVYGLIYVRNGGTAYMYTDNYGLQITTTLFNQ